MVDLLLVDKVDARVNLSVDEGGVRVFLNCKARVKPGTKPPQGAAPIL